MYAVKGACPVASTAHWVVGGCETGALKLRNEITSSLDRSGITFDLLRREFI